MWTICMCYSSGVHVISMLSKSFFTFFLTRQVCEADQLITVLYCYGVGLLNGVCTDSSRWTPSLSPQQFRITFLWPSLREYFSILWNLSIYQYFLYPHAEPGHRRLCRGSDLAVTNIEMLTVIEQNKLPKSAQKSFLLTPGLPDAFPYLSKK